MIELKNDERLALHAVANFDCFGRGDVYCEECPFYANVSSPLEDFPAGCISIYLKRIADKYYTERTDK